jgi:hypothetical protein
LKDQAGQDHRLQLRNLAWNFVMSSGQWQRSLVRVCNEIVLMIEDMKYLSKHETDVGLLPTILAIDRRCPTVWQRSEDVRLRKGTELNDHIDGSKSSDLIIGLAGDDLLRGASGDDVIQAGTDNDNVYGNNGNDNLQGGPGLDQLYGESGDDVIFGGFEDDFLVAGSGNDEL